MLTLLDFLDFALFQKNTERDLFILAKIKFPNELKRSLFFLRTFGDRDHCFSEIAQNQENQVKLTFLSKDQNLIYQYYFIYKIV